MVPTVRRAKVFVTESLTSPFSLGSAASAHGAFQGRGKFL